MSISNATPVFAVDEKNLVPVSDHLKQMADIPPSRMFLINKSLKVYAEKNPGAKIFDASQGDGGASLPGAPKAILERAYQLQVEHGTAYDMPYGTDAYRKSVVEQYWKLDSASGWGPANVLGTAGGRDALVKAVKAATETPAWKETLQKTGWTPWFLGGDEFKAFLEEDTKRIAAIIESLGLKK